MSALKPRRRRTESRWTQWVRRLLRRLGLLITVVYRKELKASPAPPAGVSVALVDREVLNRYVNDPAYQLTPEFLTAAFERGDACVGTFTDEGTGKQEQRLVAYGWVGYGAVPHQQDVWVETAPTDRYNYKSLTLPAFRGRHWRGSFGVLDALDRTQGVTHSVSFIEVTNRASRRAALRSGSVAVGYAGFWRIAGRSWCFRSPGARRAGFRFVCLQS